MRAGDQTVRSAVRRFGIESSVDDIRRFLLDQRGSSPEALPAEDQSLRVTVRILPYHVEVAVEARPPAPDPAVALSSSRFADWFQRTIRAHGLTQQAAARRLGVSGKTVNRWVRGHTEPRLRELRQVQSVFGGLPPL